LIPIEKSAGKDQILLALSFEISTSEIKGFYQYYTFGRFETPCLAKSM